MLTKDEVLEVISCAETYLTAQRLLMQVTHEVDADITAYCCIALGYALKDALYELGLRDKDDSIRNSFCALYQEGLKKTFSFAFDRDDDSQNCRFLAFEFAKRFIETEGVEAFLALGREPWR
jgi:hypothetical protein